MNSAAILLRWDLKSMRYILNLGWVIVSVNGVYFLHEITAILGPAKSVTTMSRIGLKERKFKGEKIRDG